jgi:hypothetical protein
MTISIIHAIGAASLIVVTSAAAPMCNGDSSGSASAPSAAGSTTASSAASSGSGLPADIPVDPALSACRPVIAGPVVSCEWHDVDGHQAYTFYHEALPKAGYVVDPGSLEGNIGTPSYRGEILFKKGSVKGAVTISGGYVSLHVITGQ